MTLGLYCNAKPAKARPLTLKEKQSTEKALNLKRQISRRKADLK